LYHYWLFALLSCWSNRLTLAGAVAVEDAKRVRSLSTAIPLRTVSKKWRSQRRQKDTWLCSKNA